MFQALSRSPSSGNERKGIRKSGCLQGVYQLWERSQSMHNVMDVVRNLQRVMVGSSNKNPGSTLVISFKVAGELRTKLFIYPW